MNLVIRGATEMNEIEKMYKNAKVKPVCDGLDCFTCTAKCNNGKYPPFTAEKQLEIENVILQNKKNYNKWIEYNINVYGEWVIRFVRTDKFAPYIALGKTRAEAFVNIINHFWQDLTPEEKQQIKEILDNG